MLAALAVAQLIHHQYQAAQPGPGHAHVLKFALAFGVVMAVANENARHQLVRFGRLIKIGGSYNTGPGFENQVFNPEAIPLQSARDPNLEIFGNGRKPAERIAKRTHANVAVGLPILPRFDFFPGPGFTWIDGIPPRSRRARQHLAQLFRLIAICGQDGSVQLAELYCVALALRERIRAWQRAFGTKLPANGHTGPGQHPKYRPQEPPRWLHVVLRVRSAP